MIGIKKFDEAREYWLAKLEETPDISPLAADFPAAEQSRLSTLRFPIENALAARLEQMGKGNQLSVYIILQTAFKILLSTFTDRDELVVVSPVYDSKVLDYNKVVLFRDRLDPSQSFKEFLLAVRATVLEGYRHQYYPVEKLLDILDLSAQSPLFSFGFTHRAIHQREFVLDFCKVNLSHVTVEFAPEEKGAFFEVYYNSAAYSSVTIQSFMASFLTILRQAAEQPSKKIDHIEVMEEAVKQEVLRAFNGTGAQYPDDVTLQQLFYDIAHHHPQRPALWGWSERSASSECLTYESLARLAGKLSRRLFETGVEKNGTVGLLFESSIEMIAAMLGVLGAGCSYLPMDPAFPQSRIEFMCRDSNVDVVVARRCDERLVPDGCRAVVIEDCDAMADNPQFTPVAGQPSDLAYTIYTSGTTGDPKGVQVEHRGVVNYIHWRIRAYEVTAEDVSLQPLSYCFDGFVSNMYTPLLSGGQLVMVPENERLDFAAMGRLVQQHGVTHVSLVPGLFSALLDNATIGQLASLRFVVLAGEAAQPQLLARIKTELPQLLLINEYGPTEASVTAAAQVGMDGEPGMIGRPIANTGIFILDRRLKPVPPGASGQLYISGHGLARCYVNSPELTERKFLTALDRRMYASGDLARFRADGRIQLLGRGDFQVKIRGHRVELEEIQHRLSALDSVNEAVVVAKRDDGGEQYLCAYLTANGGGALNIDAIRRELEHYLPGYMIPRFMMELENLPLTVAGKVNRRALPEPTLFSGASFTAPSDQTEQGLQDIWGRILNVSPDLLGIDADFFTIGGHSLNATRMVSLVHKELGATLTLAEIFEARTIRLLADVIRPRVRSRGFRALEPAEERDYYSLSPAQQRLFVVQQLELHSIAYNMPEVIELQEEPDVSRLEEAFRQLIRRHESLRTGFVMLNGQPAQRIRQHVDFSIERFQLNISGRQDAATVDSWIRDTVDKFVRPFDLARPPLLRVGFVMAGQRPVLLVDMHHIISDGVSMGILTQEFLRLMEGEALPPLRLQYKDYSQWLTSPEQQETAARQRDFWVEQFSGDIPVLQLPQDFPRPQTQDFSGDVAPFVFGREFTARLKELAQRNDATLYMVLLALFNVLLFKLSLQEDIVVGTPLAGRRHADLEQMIGMFVNTLALRNFPNGRSSFTEFLNDVRQNALAAFENQEYQFEELVEQLSLRRDVSRNPLFDVMFSMQHLERGTHENGGPEPQKSGDLTFHSSKFDLTFSAVERDDQIFCRMTYALRLFKPETVETWIHYFNTIVRQVCGDPALALADIDVMEPHQRRQWLDTLTAPAVPFPTDKPVSQLLLDQAEAHPDLISICQPSAGLHISFGHFKQLCAAGARILCEHGVGRRDIVAVMCSPGADIATGIFSILLSGASFLPIDPTMPSERIRYILRDSGATLLLVQPGQGREFAAEITVVEIDTSPPGEEVDCCVGDAPRGDDPLYVIYTSGTTGRPKGVRLTQHNLVNYMSWFSRTLGLGIDDRSLPVSSFAYDLGYSALFPAVCGGGRLTMATREEYMEPAVLLDMIARERITYLKLTPSFFSAIAQHPSFEPGHCGSLRWVVLGGEAIAPGDVEQAWKRCPQLRFMNHYGPTEACIGAVARVLEPEDMPSYKGRPTIGKPVDNTFACVVDTYGNPLPAGIPGELCLAGAGLAAGYLNRPGLTAQSFTPLPGAELDRVYHTGDLAVMEPDGEIRFLGRKDLQVKIRGFRVEPAEVEVELARHPQVKEAAVLALNRRNESFLAAYVVPVDNEEPDWTATLTGYLGRRLPDYMIPATFVLLDAMPLTPNGKLDRAFLPQPDLAGGPESAAPQTETEQQLLNIWAEVLDVEVESIGVDDDFFRIGGHSLRATIMISRIQAELGVRIPLAEVFKTPTVKGLARIVSVSDKEFYDSIQPADPKPYYPQSSAQKRMFFLDQFEEIGVSYNMPFVLEIPGQLDITLFQRTLDTLIARHETLRTSFGLEAGQPVQYIHEPDAIQFKIQEIITNEPVSSPEQVRRIIDSFVRPFNLSRPPLLRVAAVRLPDERNLLLFDTHHIIFDGSSRGVLTEEFIRIHEGAEPEPLRLHYKDFAVWQDRMIACGRIRQQERYWMEVFAGDPPVLDLPTDFPRPPVFLFEGSNVDFQLSIDDSEAFTAFCRERGATLFMGLMAVFNILLYKYSGQEDIVVGTGIAGRHHADLQRIVGMFVNSLALRTRPQARKSFGGLLEEVRDHALQAFENQDVQFEDLVDKLNLPRDPSRNPLFSATLVLQNFERSDEKLEGAQVSRFEYENRASKVDLALFAQEGGGQLYFSFEYCTRLFKPTTIQRMAGALENLIQQVLERPDADIRTYDCVSPREKQRIVEQLNDATDLPTQKTTLPQLWQERVEQSPHHIAFFYDRQELTFKRVEHEVLNLARYLRRNGVGDGSPVGVLMDSSPSLAVAMLAISRAGGAYVPMDPATPEQRLRLMIDDATIGIVISQKRLIRLLNRLQWDCPGLHTFLCLDSRDVWSEREVEQSGMMDQKLWHYIAEQADDDITAGGWVSSYTGKPLSSLEMEEFGDNAFKKLRPLLCSGTRVLEIGCASGFTMFRVAPLVERYVGTDLSSVIIQRNQERVRRERIDNIELQCLAAHDIHRLEGQTFDLIIINSVIQSFHGHNYLRQVLRQTLRLLDQRGTIFIGDVMDQDLKGELQRDLMEYQRLHHHEPGIKTKTELSEELFISRGFWLDWQASEPTVRSIDCSTKIHTVENELTRFRYDAIITVDKDNQPKEERPAPNKRQHDRRALEQGAAHEVTLPEVSSSQPAYMIFTSGTTGVPKGIVIRHRNIVNYCLWRWKFYGFTEADRALQLIAPAFDGFASNLYPSLLAGGQVVMIRREFRLDYRHIAEQIQRYNVTHFSVVPAMYRELLECAAPEQLASVRLAVLAAEGAGEELLRLHEARAPHITLANEYGPTENAVATTAYIGTSRRTLGVIGKSVAHNHCLVLAKDLSLLPAGVPGELAVLGASLGAGYLNRPLLTSDRFVPCPLAPEQTMYLTGDRVRLLDDGNLEFLGRVDNQIKIRGFRVELGGIEQRLSAHPNVRDAVVVAVGSGESLALAAYVESSEPGLKDYLAGFFPDYMIPSFIVPMQALPRTATGKIDRKALPEPGIEVADNRQEIVPGSSEERMRDVWAAVLGIDSAAISLQKNFFDLGGNSLKATALQRRIQGEFAVKIPLAEIFKTPTIEDLIRFIHQEGADIVESRDPQLECLRPHRRGSDNLFLIHAGSGEVDGYAGFCGHLAPDFACWGIKAKKPVALAPFNTTIEALASGYVEKILTIQPQGPYYLFGWCIGGTIAFEMSRQLEQKGLEVAMLAIVNALPPDREAAAAVSPFTLAREVEWLRKAVPHLAEEKTIVETKDIDELWKEIAVAVKGQAGGVSYLKRQIPPTIAQAIPNFETLQCEQLLDYFNLGRSLSQSRLLYIPGGQVEAPVSFFQVQEGNPAPWEGWQPHCRKPVRVFEVRGDHFSVFRQPFVEEFSRLFGKLLRQ